MLVEKVQQSKRVGSNLATRMDTASVMITSLQTILKAMKGTNSSTEDGLLQQHLDEEGLYIKQIPHVSSHIRYFARMNKMFIRHLVTHCISLRLSIRQ